MELTNTSEHVCPKKHKKHKKDRDDKPGLKLILKVGSNNTPEHEEEYVQPILGEDGLVLDPNDPSYALHRAHHKKSKKKKKKKDKNKDRERRHKHHHKDKKRKKEEIDEEDNVDGTYSEMDTSLGVYPLIGSPNSHREQRTCVIKKIQERTPLSKALDHLLTQLEKKDPQNFFAWPVTDNIAPGYSKIISKPMDFSTMRQKVEDNQYKILKEFIEDFHLMCENAMKYNHVDTIYFKASKKLLQAGLKILQQDKLIYLLQVAPELTDQEIGFEITPELRAAAGVKLTDENEGIKGETKEPPTPEEILAQAKAAARLARAKLRGLGPSMGYLRARRDGTAQLSILVGNNFGKRKAVAPLGSLVGRLNDGSAHLQGFREDRRNTARPVKPLYYGAFGSYAPSHDSAFANLTKEESALVLRTYGSDAAVQYAESIQDFVKGSDYAEHLVDSLLDLLSGGDHSKTKSTLEEGRRLKDEEEAVRTVLESTPTDTVKVNVDDLRSLQDLGIDVNFLDSMEDDIKQAEERHEMQQKLNDMRLLLEKLQKTQYERLSQALPASLHNVPGPTPDENSLAEQCVDGLTELSKKAAPGAIAPVPAIRRALGVPIAPAMPEPEPDLETELRQFLEQAPAHLETDNAIEEILMD
ncbi:bromodomain containing 7/9 [Rhynchophorus ferrugineus]|uniref:Bromo domain-containing protein n=1 Tax=Rhynchophorus ferrugineus TaxID=354439 RepID=A0A834IJK1_RHYFE|nr:hypothetical protein GWI33_003229 [Rhynchophorus ferrugineus]